MNGLQRLLKSVSTLALSAFAVICASGKDDDSREKLQMIETLLKVRLPAMAMEPDSTLNSQLNKVERIFKENSARFKLEKEASTNDFEKDLGSAVFTDRVSIPGGVAAEVLTQLCHAAGCAYQVVGDKVYVHQASTDEITQDRTYPQPVVDMFFTKSKKKSRIPEASLSIKPAIKASKARGRAVLTYDLERFRLSMKGNAFNLYETNQMLNDMYFDWLRSPEAANWGAVNTRDKRFQFDCQLAHHRAVPTKFKAGTPLKELVQYLGLHMRTGQVKKPVRIIVQGGDADLITLEQELDFSYATVLDALIAVCDACRGHYFVKGSKLVIVPNRLESRQYEAAGPARKAFKAGNALWKYEKDRKKRRRYDTQVISSDNVVKVLRQCGIHIPRAGGVFFPEGCFSLTIETSQQGFRDLECLLHYLRH